MTDDLRARLESHARTFEGMLSLIPAKDYYGKDNDDQWQRKKQTKEQKRAARKAKLDPANYKSALDVHKENALKRKRELEGEDAVDQPTDGTKQPSESLKTLQQPLKKQKRDEQGDSAATPEKPALTPEEDEAVRKAKAEKRRSQRERKKEKKQKSAQAKQARKLQKKLTAETKVEADAAEDANPNAGKTKESANSKKSQKKTEKSVGVRTGLKAGSAQLKTRKPDSKTALPLEGRSGRAGDMEADEDENEDEDEDEDEDDDEVEVEDEYEDEDDGGVDNEKGDADELDTNLTFDIDGFGNPQEPDSEAESASSTSVADTPTFDTSHRHSSASSSSSVVPPSEPDANKTNALHPSVTQQELSVPQQSQPQHLALDTKIPSEAQPFTEPDSSLEKHPKLPQFDPEVLRQRLEAKLAQLRAARKADGLDGRPAKNRQELIEGRRAKQEKRKQHKKELRNQAAKKEHDAEAEATRLRGGSGSPMWSPAAVLSPREQTNSFSFGRVAFADGETDASMSGSVDSKKKKGPQDPKTALEAAERKRSRLGGLDQEKRKDIEEKDRWLNAKKRVQGEKVRDNTSLLKKTLKRKEKGKAKSEKEWVQRKDGVEKIIAAKQKRREENLKKRRDEKGMSGKKGKTAPKPKPKSRPGFEGSLKLGTRK